jgi:hypothetical protein
VLQHGSLLTDPTHLEIADVLQLSSDSEREAVRAMLARKATDLSEVMQESVSFARIAAAMRAGFERAWGLTLAPGDLTERESEAVARLTTTSVKPR